MMAIDLREFATKGARLIDASLTDWHRVDLSSIRAIPGSPFAYWAPPSLIDAYKSRPVLGDIGLAAVRTNSIDNDFRYVRCSWEASPLSKGVQWVPWAKGGSHSTFYLDIHMAIAWSDARRTYPGFLGTASRPQARPASAQFFSMAGLTWSRRSQIGLSIRALPAGCVFGDNGPSIFDQRRSGERCRLLPHLAVLNSTVFRTASLLLTSFGSYQVGVIQRTPVPDLDAESSEALAGLAHRGWGLRRSLDTCVEVSHAFVVPAVLQVEGDGFAVRVMGWAERVESVEAELAGVQSEIDELCFELYGIADADRRVISEGFGISADSETSDTADEDADDDDEDSGVELDPIGLAAGLVSWCVGVAAGRFDVRLATGEREWPGEPDPFDPLPVCSPGMLTGDDGLPLVEPPVGYPLRPSPVLVVDPGHRLDVASRVREIFDVVFGEQADRWWTEVGEVLDPRGGEPGSWLAKGFFEHHLKTYSKSRRKAPVLWPIGTSSGSYQVWLYAHRVTGDSLFRVLNDLIVPKLNTEESRLVRLRQEAGPNPSASERKTIDTQEKLVSELVELRETVEDLAPLWAPDLDDGTVIVLAPLWRLFSHHKPWMRELKNHWAKLVEGDYDWARLAMHLWPERVIPKCADDRSLAIAHDLEDVFWQPDPDNNDKWTRRETPTTPIDQLIAHRHNPATKVALTRMGGT